MNILVVGCEHVGAALTRDLELAGHDISLIEKMPDNLRRLERFEGYTFGGSAMTGDATDPEVLRRAGIQNCDAVAVVGSNDADNLMTAQIAQNIFNKKNVVCRVSQTELATIYQENYGLKTICPTVLTVGAVFQNLEENEEK